MEIEILPWPSDPAEPEDHGPDRDPGADSVEVLIPEARQRARRRRIRYGVAALVVAWAGLAVFSTMSGSPAPPGGARAGSAAFSPTSLGAPLVEGPDPASTLLASWGQIEEGWVFVYADGRVIWGGMPVLVDADGRVTAFIDRTGLPEGWWMDPALTWDSIERQLSPLGLDQVRTGRLTARDFVRATEPHWRDELWAEPTARRYEPSRYAICADTALTAWTDVERRPAAEVADLLDDLPAPAQALLDGTQHTYPHGGAEWMGGSGVSMGASGTPTECFEVTAADTATLFRIFAANGQIIDMPGDPPQTPDSWWVHVPGGAQLSPIPVYPHGQYVIFGG